MPNLPLFLSQLARLSGTELRFVVEALHDGAALAGHEACVCPDDYAACTARKEVLDELWCRLLSDVNTRMGHLAAAE